MGIPLLVWLQRICWAALPFAAAPAVSGALDGSAGAIAATVGLGSWALWVVVMVASLVPLPLSLTLVRTLAPLAVPLTAWAALVDTDITGLVSVALAVAGAGLSLSGWVADAFVDGGSYGEERRFALRIPVAFLAGPIPVFWSICAAALAGGVLLLASGHLLAGIPLLALGLAVTRRAAPAFHALSRRWLVFVPAGLTVVDHLALAEPVLLPRSAIASVERALVGSEATDLSGSAPGAAIEIGLATPVDAAVRHDTADEGADIVALRAVLVTPSRAGVVLAEAARRGLGSA